MSGKGKRKKIEAVGYMRTSSVSNVGADKELGAAAADGHRGLRQARRLIVDWFYDPAVKGSDPVTISGEPPPSRQDAR